MILCDTSVLVAASVRDHPDYQGSHRLVERICHQKIEASLASHSLAEFYSVITATPVTPRVHPSQAHQIIEETILKFFEFIELDLEDYRRATENVMRRNMVSGAIFDALILQAAVKRSISRVVTWNLGDFRRLATEGIEILSPEEV